MQKIQPCLWFDGTAEQAARFYTSVFQNSRMGIVTHYGEVGAKASGHKVGEVMTAEFEIEGQKILGLNGGPHFTFTPSMSFFVWRKTEKEVESLWNKLAEGGTARMALDSYPWSKKYGWTTDKFGVEWQVMLSPENSERDGIAPAFLFVDKVFGKGEEAIQFYVSQFKDAKIDFMARDEATQSIMHCVFSLAGQTFALMEGQGEHGHTFSPAFSLIVNCDTQAEIDTFWTTFSTNGGAPGQCGWLDDKFGVSWQVVPSRTGEWLSNPKKADKVMAAVVTMTKIDLRAMQQAYES